MSRSPPCPPTSQKTQDGLAMLLGQAISESPQTQMTVGEMCAWIIKRLPTDSCHSLSVLQTLIHHSLTQNKAFRREELTTVATTATNPCASEIWTLQLNAPLSNGPLVPAKRKSTEPTDSGISTNANTTTSTTMKKSIDTISIPTATPTTITSTHDIVEDTPSPSPEDTRPRRSGRSRRPPKPKEADDYITHSIHLTSRRHASPTTPPTSPPPNKVTEDPPPIKKRGSVKFDKHIVTTIPTKEHPTTIDTVMRTPVEEPVMMSPRLRRPPQNLSEFVSSEDFKAAPCGKRMDRAFTACGPTTPSSHSPVAVDGGTRTVRPDRKDKKRSKSESNVSNAANNILTANIATTASTTSPPTQTTYSAKPTKPTMEATSTEVLEPQLSRGTNINPRPRPVSIPLSALSHSKRRSEDFSTCFQRSGEVKKRQRRSQSVQLQSMTLDHHHQRRDFPSRHEIYEQRRQYRLQRSKHGKRGGSGDDEEDSDSDFDFLKEEEENYRMRILTAKRQLALTGRLGRLYESGDEYEDEVDEDEVYLRELEGHEGGRRKTFARCRDQEGEEAREKRGITGGGCGQEYERSCRAEGERIKLLMDPSVITYGFDSCDGQYILDYNQGPLFNNVTWPEFSDLKDLKGINPNNSGSVNSNGHDHIEATISDQGALETRLSTTNSSMDAALEADKDGVPLALSSVFPALAGCGPEVAFASTDIKSRHMDSDAEAKEWGLLIGQGGGRPSIEGNTVMDRRLERQLSLSSLFSLLSAKQEPLKLIPEVDAEMSPADTESLVKLSEDILAGVAAEDDLLAGTGCKAEDTSKAGVVPTGEEEEEDVQVEEFIGLSWCQ
ncbi:hypothetical protein BGZ74_007961 [Mortierella antarctica]|nr:hypothetical protein BGZ74_007961 [Mortierella antarctica]